MFQIYVLLRSSLMMFFALDINLFCRSRSLVSPFHYYGLKKKQKEREMHIVHCLSLISFFLLSSPSLSLIYYSFSFPVFSYSCCFFFRSSFSHIRYPLYAILSFFIYSVLAFILHQSCSLAIMAISVLSIVSISIAFVTFPHLSLVSLRS